MVDLHLRPVSDAALAGIRPQAGAAGTAGLPQQAAAAAARGRDWSSEEVRHWVEALNRSWQGERIGFGLVERLNALYVQVYDRSTGKVLREFPPKELLERQAALAEMIGLILNRRA